MEDSFMELFCGSPFLDSNLTWNTDDPDLTPCFQRTVLVWLPCAFLWALSPVEAYFIVRKWQGTIVWNWRNVSKVAFCGLLFLLSIAEFIFTIYQSSQGFETFLVDYWTPIIKAATFVLCAVLIHYNRKRGLRTSGVQFVFWFLLMVLGAVQFRYEIRRSQSEYPPDPYFPVVAYIVSYVVVLATFISYFIPDVPPIKSPYPPIDKPCPMLAAPYPARLFFSWLDSFVWKGYRTPLKEKDMWDLSPENSAKRIVTDFQKYWHPSGSTYPSSAAPKATFNHNSGSIDFVAGKAEQQQSVLPALCKMFGLVFLSGSVVRVFGDFLPFINPQLLSQLIAFVGSDEPMWHGFFYAGLMLVAAIVQMLVNSHFQFHMFVIGLKARTAIISIIYQKALRMSSGARKESTVGEIVNLMAVDANRIIEVTMHLNMCITAPLVIAMSLYFLWDILGPSVLAGLVFMVILVPVNSYIAKKVKSLQIRQMKSKDVRLRMMNEILNGIRVLKLYAWEPSYEQEIYKIRDKEVKVLKEAAYFNAATSFIWSCAPFLVSLVTFATYVLVDENNVLDAQKAFVSLSLFNIMRMPLMMIPMVMNSLIQAHVAFQRINKYLRAEELDPSAITHDNEKCPLIIEKGTFAWGKDEAPVLTDINLKVNEGALVAVVGSVGAGKSSLISALLGEMDKLTGRVNTRGSIAYVPQQAWIQNASLKDNIMFGCTPDNHQYQQVIEACALLQDFKVLPGGDETEIGEKGINLSGGQKQRVSLARAIYNKCDVFLLDDPLSAVDSHVGKHIFEKVVGPFGMLKNKTRLLVTHGITYLPEVDDIIVLKDGEVSERGTYKELVNKKGAFSEFLEQHLQEIVENDATSEADFEELKQQLESDLGPEEFQRKLSRAISRVSESRSLSGSIGDTQSLRRRFSVSSSKSGNLSRSRSGSRLHLSKVQVNSDRPAPFIAGKKLIEAEKAEVGNVKWGVYKHYTKSIGLMLMLATLIFNAIFQGFQVGSNLWLTVWSENGYGTINETTNLTETSPQDLYLSVYGVLGVGQVVSTCIATLAISIGTINAATLLHNGMLANILRLPQSLFDTTPVGRILTRFSSDVNVLDTMFPFIIRASIPNIYRVAATFVVIIYSTPIFIAIFIPLSVVYYFMQRVYVATSRQMKRLESVTRAPVYSHFGESITGAAIIRAYGVQDKFIKDSEMKVDLNQMCVYPSHCCSSWLSVRLETIGSLIIFFASLFAVLSRDTMNAGFVGLSVSYAMQITNTLNMLVRMASDIETNIVAVERIKEYSEYEQEAAWEKPKEKVTPDWPTEGKVEFRNYQLRYREGLPLVLKGINSTIRGGEKVGIVGRTGAGKSSLTLALFRIIEAAEGAILIDGVDISTLGLHTVRARITIIPQDPVLFSGTLRKNLDPFESLSDDTLWVTLEHAHLKAFVKGLPAGLNHEVAEGGENLSVGQRQLICLARALLRKTKVLVLDEATAAVDLETDDLIQATIRKQFNDCTILTIAHRLNTIVDSDRVIVLDDGKVIEFDSPNSLLQNKESVFYSMARNAGIV